MSVGRGRFSVLGIVFIFYVGGEVVFISILGFELFSFFY